MESIEELSLIGGHVALDFVNTAEERGHPDAGDALHTPADLRLWGRRCGLLVDGVDDQAELRRALDARELLYRLLYARVHGRPPAPDDLARLARLGAEAYRAGELVTVGGALEWRWPGSELATVRHVAVTSAIELLLGQPRLKQCPGDHCGWFFLDATKRGNRRWCSMGECGQDAKVARRRARRAAA
jgi:predicted RNA-binding Zn ribbon-like protein